MSWPHHNRITLLAARFGRRGGAALCLCFLLCLALPAQADTITIYHYNPESHSDRSLVLKNTFDRYFQAKYNIALQPVDDRTTFQSLIQQNTRGVFILSDWHYRQLAAQNPTLTPYLRGRKAGQDTFRKLLVGKQALAPDQTTIAFAGSEDYAWAILRAMAKEQRTLPPLNQIRLLAVPKDIDALMAVSFGMADGALAAENNVTKHAQLYSNENQPLSVLASSQPQKRLVVVLFQPHHATLKPALEALTAMPTSDDGKLGLHLLGLDEWTPLTSTQTQGGQP